jgi:hypothetical protein
MISAIHARRTLGALAVAALAAAAACSDSTGPSCDSPAATRRTVVQTSLNSGDPVATFHLDQLYGTGNACGGLDGDVHVVVTSDAPVTQSFTYTIQGLDGNGGVAWTASGSVQQLRPGGTTDLGTVINTQVPVDDGVRVLLDSWSSP